MSFQFIVSVIILLDITLISSCDRFGKPTKDSTRIDRTVDIHEVFGHYISNPDNGEAYCELNLDSDFHYVYHGWGCLGGLIDSGKFKINVDTVEFISSILVKEGQYFDSTHTKVICLDNEQYLFQSGKLFVNYKNEAISKNNLAQVQFLLRKDLTLSLPEMLDSNGNGQAIIYNGNGFIFSKGDYRNFKLWEGSEYKVTPDNRHIHIDYYYQGIVLEDTIVKYSSMYREQKANW